MTPTNEYNLKEILADFIKKYKIQDKIYSTKINQSWEKIMGSDIASHTINLSLIDRKLIVTLDSCALKNELLLAKSKIILALNKHFGINLVDEIILR